jgi:zona occludens toxin
MSDQIGAGLMLVTGNTGSGKTALVVKMLRDTPGRPAFVMGIPDLKLDCFQCPPVEQWTELRPDPDDPKLLLPYFTFPENAIVIIDEAQRIYRPRPSGSKVPDFVAAFETRRHTGVDFVLLTQHPTFIDTHCRKLVKRHIHIHETTLGRFKLEWTGIGEPDNVSSRALAARERYSPPKEVFGLYKSSVLHTKEIKKRPVLIYVFIPLLLALVGGLYYVNKRLDDRVAVEAVAGIPSKPESVKHISGPIGGKEKSVLAAQEYIAQYKPRIEGLMHTAPAYDKVTEPVEPPEIVGCVQRKTDNKCICYDQQGNHYRSTLLTCTEFLDRGIFYAWKKTSGRSESRERNTREGAARSKPEATSVADRIGWIQTADSPMELTSNREAPVVQQNTSTNPRLNPSILGGS